MAEPQPKIQTMKISDVRSQFNALVNRVYRKETRVIVEKSGLAVAALVSTEDLARLDRYDLLAHECAEPFHAEDE